MSFTKRTNAPFRLDVVGSFLRPEAIKEARTAFAAGTITADELKAVEDRCITELVENELAAGLQCVTDGEFRRSYWHLDFMWGFEGVEHIVGEHGYLFHGEETRADTARITGRIRFAGHPFLEHFCFLQELVNGRAIPRLTIPAPAQFYSEQRRPGNAEALAAVYPNEEEFFQDLIQAYTDFIRALYDAGCRSLQLDDCTWGMLCSPEYRQLLYGGDEGADAAAQLYVALNNAVLDSVPRGMTVNTHVCRGNFHSTWAASGGYAPVSKILFQQERVDGYYLEFDDERSGGFEPLADLAEGKIVVLGLITSKRPQLEEKQHIKERILEAAQYVPLDRLCLSPQCGFASTEEGNKLTEADQWKKLALIREIAEEVWG